jgi:hypothetical protein
MNAILAAAAVVITLAGCATQKPSDRDHAAHHPQGGPPAAKADQQMKTMQDMHQKMMAAKTPEERKALMAEHMKAMQGGMSMMCEMGGGMGAGTSGSADTMKRCMDMKDMTVQMMMDREGAKAPSAK